MPKAKHPRLSFTRTVKVRRPLASDGEEIWEVYDEARTHVDRIAPYPLLRDLMGARMTAFFVATWSQDEGWIIKRRAPWPLGGERW